MQESRSIFEKIDNFSVLVFNPDFAWWLLQYKLSLITLEEDDYFVGQSLRSIAEQKGFIPKLIPPSQNIRDTWMQH